MNLLRRLPYSLAVLSMVGGVFIAILFGVNEELFKKRIEAGLERNPKLQQLADPTAKAAKLASEADKNWRYYQRYHFHATGIGAMMMGLLLFLSRLDAPLRLRTAAAYLISTGGFLYPFIWLFAGIYGPEMGRSEAKETFAVFGYMGAVFLLGGLLTGWLGLRHDVKA